MGCVCSFKTTCGSYSDMLFAWHPGSAKRGKARVTRVQVWGFGGGYSDTKKIVGEIRAKTRVLAVRLCHG